MISLDPRAAHKLAKVLALFSSPHNGERAAAALATDKLVRSAGMTWDELVGAAVAPMVIPRPAEDSSRFSRIAQMPLPPADPPGRAMWAAAHLRRLNAQELAFLEDMTGWTGPLSRRQPAWLDVLVQRARTERRS